MAQWIETYSGTLVNADRVTEVKLAGRAPRAEEWRGGPTTPARRFAVVVRTEDGAAAIDLTPSLPESEARTVLEGVIEDLMQGHHVRVAAHVSLAGHEGLREDGHAGG